MEIKVCMKVKTKKREKIQYMKVPIFHPNIVNILVRSAYVLGMGVIEP